MIFFSAQNGVSDVSVVTPLWQISGEGKRGIYRAHWIVERRQATTLKITWSLHSLFDRLLSLFSVDRWFLPVTWNVWKMFGTWTKMWRDRLMKSTNPQCCCRRFGNNCGTNKERMSCLAVLQLLKCYRMAFWCGFHEYPCHKHAPAKLSLLDVAIVLVAGVHHHWDQQVDATKVQLAADAHSLLSKPRMQNLQNVVGCCRIQVL